MRLRLFSSAAVCAGVLLLSGCGDAVATAPPAADTPATVTPSAPLVTLPSAAATATATPAPTANPLAALPAFPTLAAAHSYEAAQAGKFYQNATVSQSQAGCPSSGACYIISDSMTQGTNTAYFVDSIDFNPTGAVVASYYYYDSAGWHWLTAMGTQMSFPSRDEQTPIAVDRGCANIHNDTSTTSPVVACLASGTIIKLGSAGPDFADGHIWFQVSDHPGWIIIDNLIGHFTLGKVSE